MITTQTKKDVFIGAECSIPNVRMIGHWLHTRHRPDILQPHMHTEAYEICYVAEGAADWWIEGKRFDVKAGHFFVAKPCELHGATQLASSPAEVFWIQVAFAEGVEFAGLSLKETAMLRADLDSIRTPSFIATQRPSRLFNLIIDALNDPSEMALLRMRVAVHELLILVVTDYGLASFSPGTARSSVAVERAMTWIDDHLGDEFSIEDVAKAAGVAASHLHKLFSDQVGDTPGDYRTRRRVAEAKRCLRSENGTISDIAFRTGFSSSQYFATVFKSLTGVTPRQYRESAHRDDPMPDVAVYMD